MVCKMKISYPRPTIKKQKHPAEKAAAIIWNTIFPTLSTYAYIKTTNPIFLFIIILIIMMRYPEE